VTELGAYRYTVRAWVDRFGSWRGDFEKKVDAGQDVAIDLLAGAELAEHATRRTKGGDGRILRRFVSRMREGDVDAALEDELDELMARYPDRSTAVTYERELEAAVGPTR